MKKETLAGRCAIALVFLVIALAQGGDAHTGTLLGKVIDGQSKTPLAGAHVAVEGTTRGASADADGGFVIAGIPAGTYTVSASSVGYLRQVRAVVAGPDTTTVTFQLAVDVLVHERDIEAPQVFRFFDCAPPGR